MSKVQHPDHYNGHPSGVECLTIVRWCNFNIGNVIKYCWRWMVTHKIQDLQKAKFYLEDEIERLTKLGEEEEEEV